MQITSILAIYFLFWVFTAFLMLPFGVRTAEEAGEALVPGQAESAPVNFQPKRLLLRATVIAAVLTALFIANYEMGWITVADIDFLPKPPSALEG
ncbi:MAG: hypothetical protein ABS49_09375 [Erythrobacter sp. SCN 62-14]|nr:MAG: hypothetical protein ABS49_09375 [Erythrobacter sp. SCN 62-14]